MEQGLWTLFFETGLPQAYLAIRGRELERERERDEGRATTAFRAGGTPPGQI